MINYKQKLFRGIFGQLHIHEYKAMKKQIVKLQLNEKNSKESQTRLMSWYWKRKPTWRKGLITFNSPLWIMFSFNWLVIILEKGVRLKLDVQDQGMEKCLDVDGQGGWGVLKIGQFWWKSCVYHALIETRNFFF